MYLDSVTFLITKHQINHTHKPALLNSRVQMDTIQPADQSVSGVFVVVIVYVFRAQRIEELLKRVGWLPNLTFYSANQKCLAATLLYLPFQKAL